MSRQQERAELPGAGWLSEGRASRACGGAAGATYWVSCLSWGEKKSPRSGGDFFAKARLWSSRDFGCRTLPPGEGTRPKRCRHRSCRPAALSRREERHRCGRRVRAAGLQRGRHRSCRPAALSRREERHRCGRRVRAPGLQKCRHRSCRPAALSRREERHRCGRRVRAPGLQRGRHRSCRPAALSRREDRHRCGSRVRGPGALNVVRMRRLRSLSQ